MGSVGHHNLAVLQVRLLEETVMLVGKTDFVGLVAFLVADSAHTGHGYRILQLVTLHSLYRLESVRFVPTRQRKNRNRLEKH